MKIIFLCVCAFISVSISVSGYPNNNNNLNNENYPSDGSETEEIAKNEPKIKSKPLTLTATEGDSITFPCEVDDLGTLQVSWGSVKSSSPAQLFFGSYRFLCDDRMYLQGNNLVIKNVNQTDTGIYTCKVSVDKDISVSHTFFVNPRPQTMKESATDWKAAGSGSYFIGSSPTILFICSLLLLFCCWPHHN